MVLQKVSASVLLKQTHTGHFASGRYATNQEMGLSQKVPGPKHVSGRYLNTFSVLSSRVAYNLAPLCWCACRHTGRLHAAHEEGAALSSLTGACVLAELASSL